MHELAVTETIVSAIRAQFEDAKVSRVMLEIGALSGVASDSVRRLFALCARGTSLEGATVEIASIPGEMFCRRCHQGSPAQSLVLTCPCGSIDVQLIHGQELRVKAVEVT